MTVVIDVVNESEMRTGMAPLVGLETEGTAAEVLSCMLDLYESESFGLGMPQVREVVSAEWTP